MGLWSHSLKNKIIYEKGSNQKIPEIPADLRSIYKTIWEIKQKILVDLAIDRDQSLSLNIYMDQPNYGKLTSLHFYAWSKLQSVRLNCSWKKNLQSPSAKMYVIKRDGRNEAVHFDKITTSLKKLSFGLSELRSRPRRAEGLHRRHNHPAPPIGC
ncbi:hypothetical protein EJ110_NYTH10742 [Nymphaea thermarum]|nr:hypothetical protein EJ110_NYTH10742 [Nymphaea thermarum]